MNKKILVIIIVIIGLLTVSIGAFLVLTSRNQNVESTNPPVQLPDNSPQFANDLISAFNVATTSIELPKESLFMVTAYSGDESKPEEIDFASDSSVSNEFYMASTIKPLFAAAYLNILEIKDLDYKVPLKFTEGDETLETIAQNISDKINYNFDEDVLLDLFILPYFKDYTTISKDEVWEILQNNPELVNFEFELRDIIKYTLGPSSNLGLTLLKHDLALKKTISEEEACNLVENYLNKMLTDKGLSGSIIINKSTKSKAMQKLNTAKFDEIQYMFDWFFKNEFKLPEETFDLMKESMREIGSDPVKFNRRHETKTITSKALEDFNISEKSGYIGFDYEAAPGLNSANGWDTLPQVDGKRIVFYTASSFARIYLNNGRFVQYNYSIAVPVYIGLDPAYEELNNDYLPVKNKIFDSLESNIVQIMRKYKEYIEE